MISESQALLTRYGYGVGNPSYMDGATRDAVAAFQRHFRPQRVDGVLDTSTLKTLKELLAARERAKPASPVVT
jgi:N-acetylmuramoyl-L-alanine amidase